MPVSAEVERPGTVLIVASPRSDWAPVAERHTRAEKNVVVLFAHDEGAKLVSLVRDRMRDLASNGNALVAIASVGILEMTALRALARAAGLPIV